MEYIAGIDGGATKTHCVIGDTKGNILAEGFASGSNYQICGKEAAKAAIACALKEATSKLEISVSDIRYTVLGLAGMDIPVDYEVLNAICGSIFTKGTYKILNDTWIGLRAGIPENIGVVTNCGTGPACAGRNSCGEEVILRNLNYEAGNIGGGADIISMALHYAFRSEEGTGEKTALEHELPKLFGFRTMDDLVEPVRSMNAEPKDVYEIPILVCRLANEGDRVCQNILIYLGHEMGDIAGGVIKRLKMERETFKVTLVGGVFQTDSPLLADEYTTTVHRAAPFAQISIAGEKPAMGAYYLALGEFNKLQ